MTTLIPKFDFKNGGATPVGAVNRPINQKLAEIVSVLDFGADPTGVTDTSTAFNNALDAIIALGGGTLYIPKGTYKVNLDWSSRVVAGGYTQIIIQGAGVGSTLLLGVTGSDSVLKINNAGTGDNWIDTFMVFENLEFRTESNVCAGGTLVISYAVQLLKTSAVWRNVTFSGGRKASYFGLNCQYTQFYSCTFRCASYSTVSSTSPSAGCWIASTYTETSANELIFESCVFTSCQTGLKVQGALGMRISNCRFQGMFAQGEGGVVLTNYIDGPQTENVYFLGCYFEFNQVCDGLFLGATRITMISCQFANPIGYYTTRVAVIQSTSSYQSYYSCDWRTSGGPTLTLSGDNATCIYVGNDKDPYSVTASAANPQGIIQYPEAEYTAYLSNRISTSGYWGKVGLNLGAYYLWVDTSGRLRIKSGAPTSDTDGTIVGTQS